MSKKLKWLSVLQVLEEIIIYLLKAYSIAQSTAQGHPRALASKR